MPLTAGQILEKRYLIEALLGQGGFGAVYRARDLRLDGLSAVKECFETSPAATSQFAREASLLFKLKHANLPKVSDYFSLPGQGLYLVMEYIEGEDLEHLLVQRGAPFHLAHVLDWAGQVCDALSYLHAQVPPVIHRDIKPANIRIMPQTGNPHGRAILVDFGIAKLFDPMVRTNTVSQAVTPGFSPPEQYGQGTNAQSDIYALGATLYCLLTSQAPPASVDIVSGSADPPLPAHLMNPAVPEAMSAAITRAMALNRRERFASVAEFQGALLPGSRRTPTTEPVLPAPVRGEGVYQRTERFPLPEPQTPSLPKRVVPSWLTQLAGLGVLGLVVGVLILWAILKLPDETPAVTTLPVVLEPATVQPGLGENSRTATAIEESARQTAAAETTQLSAAQTATIAAQHTLLAMEAEWATQTALAVELEGMVLIPAGEFQMGSQNGDSNEKPVHSVNLAAYYIDIYEVTNDRYALCVSAGNCTPPSSSQSSSRSNYYGDPHYADFPVVYVNWNQAQTFCQWSGGELPTEAQWEKAARGGLESKSYPWGDQEPVCQKDVANGAKFDDNASCNDTDTEMVGSYTINSFGLFDMAGNVWEWVKDWYSGSFYADYPTDNPFGPSSGSSRVLRGGSWFYDSMYYLRVAFRSASDPTLTFDYIGFRCARVK